VKPAELMVQLGASVLAERLELITADNNLQWGIDLVRNEKP
jgi:hypothetical protein